MSNHSMFPLASLWVKVHGFALMIVDEAMEIQTMCIFYIVELDRGTDAELIYNCLKDSLWGARMDYYFLQKQIFHQSCHGWSSCPDRESEREGEWSWDET